MLATMIRFAPLLTAHSFLVGAFTNPRSLMNAKCGTKHTVEAFEQMTNKIKRDKISKWELLMSSTDSEEETILEDADGIGEHLLKRELSANGADRISHGPDSAFLIDMNCVDGQNDDIFVEDKIDASVVIADIIEASLTDPECNGSIISPNTQELLKGPNGDRNDKHFEPPSDHQTDVIAPTVGKIIRFAVPAMGVWLCGPILSLIDTSSVGLFSGTAQQAALNPAIAVTDYTALLGAFMYTATTNLVAAAQESDQEDETKPETARTLISSLQLSGYVGAGLGTALLLFSRLFLRAIIGNDAIDPEVFSAAIKYVRIRAIGMPAALIIGSAQSACLGMQDIRSPLYVLLAAATVNFIGDMMFVGSGHPLLGGAAGAAWATIFSQYAGLFMFMKWLQTRPRAEGTKKSGEGKDPHAAKRVNLTKAILELTGKSSDGEPRRKKVWKILRQNPKARRSALAGVQPNDTQGESAPKKQQIARFSSRGFLNGRFSLRDLLFLPSRQASNEFFPYVAPVTTTSIGRVSSYVAMSHVVSSAIGTIGMAAHQVILAFFYSLTPIGDSVNLTAQSFVPPIFGKKAGASRSKAMRQTLINFLKVAALSGTVMASGVATIPLLSRFFTSDPTVLSTVRSVVPALLGIFGVHGVLLSCEGMLLGQKDLAFLGKTYGAFFFMVPFFFLRLKRAALRGTSQVGLSSVWNLFLVYQLSRTAICLWRAIVLQNRAEREHSAVTDSETMVAPASLKIETIRSTQDSPVLSFVNEPDNLAKDLFKNHTTTGVPEHSI